MSSDYQQRANDRIIGSFRSFVDENALAATDADAITVWVRKHRPILYTNLKTSGQLHSHLADVEEQANAPFLRLVKEYAASEGVTEQLKAEDTIEWVQIMNRIRVRVTEVMIQDVIGT